jgi:Concanavalin A-like lectin/glucanases superfamily
LVFASRGGTTRAQAYRDVVLSSHPSAYWRLDGAAGSPISDSSGNAMTGTTDGGVTRNQPGALSGNAATAFDGSTGCAVINSKTNPTTFSLEAWFNTTTTRGGAIVALNGSSVVAPPVGNRDRHIFMHDDGTVTFGAYFAKGVATTSGAYNDGRWHHVVATIGADGQKLYMDGALAGTSPNTLVESYDGYWHIGCSSLEGWPEAPTSGFFNGTVDEVVVYPGVLSAETVAEHYRAASPASAS